MYMLHSMFPFHSFTRKLVLKHVYPLFLDPIKMTLKKKKKKKKQNRTLKNTKNLFRIAAPAASTRAQILRARLSKDPPHPFEAAYHVSL